VFIDQSRAHEVSNSFEQGKYMVGRRRRGRPVVYELAQRKQLAELIRLHGASRTREILQRSICDHTLLKIAKEFGIELRKGRRPREAA